ncbi:hypothetical protein LSAT2_008959 [Lamellibrachia satsuma]|nr:hypothetical protein LSAT2_008959 [Lamellibrachia satsuma]
MEEKRRQDESGKQQLKYTESPKSGTSSLTATPNESHSTEKLQASSSSESTNKRTLTHEKKLNYSFFVGKRRGSAPVLKTGAVKKAKVKEEDEAAVKTDAWSQYLAEVQKYKSRSCQDEDRTRPLVK